MIDNGSALTQEQLPADRVGAVVDEYAQPAQATKRKLDFRPFGCPEDSLGYFWECSRSWWPMGSSPSVLPRQLFELLDGQMLTNNMLVDHRDPDPNGYVKWYATESLANQALLRAALKLKASMEARA